MELDVVNLIKQVSIEHVDKMKERGLELKWNVPEEKVLLMLDNQKTYRIFENLFVNVVNAGQQGLFRGAKESIPCRDHLKKYVC